MADDTAPPRRFRWSPQVAESMAAAKAANALQRRRAATRTLHLPEARATLAQLTGTPEPAKPAPSAEPQLVVPLQEDTNAPVESCRPGAARAVDVGLV